VRPEFDADFAFQFGMQKPVIAAINGPAAGVGLVIACYADLRFAVPGAKLTTAHGKLNLPVEYGLSWLLPRLIGLTRANDLLLSSRIFLTDEAMELGLLNGLFPPDELLPRTYDYVRQVITTVAPMSLAASKRQIYTDQHRDVGASVEEANALIVEMMKKSDYREAVAAWVEKRPPAWRGE
jgi:enoyl-CoA hydratase/carnithine racemase